MKLIATWVRVPSVELDGSRLKRGIWEEAVRPNHYQIGEGCHAASSNRQVGAVDSGGVSGGNTTGRGIKVSWEISERGAATPQPTAQGGEPSEAERADREVGVLLLIEIWLLGAAEDALCA